MSKATRVASCDPSHGQDGRKTDCLSMQNTNRLACPCVVLPYYVRSKSTRDRDRDPSHGHGHGHAIPLHHMQRVQCDATHLL